jgi:cell division protein FtsB
MRGKENLMDEIILREIQQQLKAVLDEQRAQRLELRRLSENQMQMARNIHSLRDELELMIKVEIGGLFAHLETRLERYIDGARYR